MKKLALSAKSCIAAIALIALPSLIVACNKSEEANADDQANTPAATTPEKKELPNIRYIDGDSIQANYNLAKDFQEFYMSSLSKMDQAQQAKANELQAFGSQIEQKMKNNGYLSQESYNADMNKYGQMQQSAQKHLADLQSSTEKELAKQQQELNDSIESFIKDYNKSKGYDAILYKAAGVYFNPALDITKEVIEGLNARYNKVKESK